MADKKKIEPGLAAGFRDFLPKDMIPRQKMFDSIRAVFERFGFVPLETPGLEREDILTGGDSNFRMQIFKTNVQTGWDALALRFDLTVPLARVVAQYQNELKRPFKRYQIGRVWRAERPQAGRYREFTQFDADIVGSNSMMADAEIVAVMYSVMRELGIENFKIRVNDRKILNGLAEYAGFPKEKSTEVLRSIDKLDKQGWDAVAEELKTSGLTSEQTVAVRKFVELRGETSEETLSLVKELMANSPLAQEGIKELGEVVSSAAALGVPNDVWAVDLSVARGLGYYTGPVFETTLTDIPEIGSVFSGGRYDGLVERFGTLSIPATGASVGVDRLFVALEKLGKIKNEKTVAKAMVLNFDSKATLYVQEVATELRNNGIPTEIYMGSEETLKAQLSFALNAEVPVIVIAGSTEMESRTVQVKDVRSREQKSVDFAEISDKVKAVLSK